MTRLAISNLAAKRMLDRDCKMECVGIVLAYLVIDEVIKACAEG